MLLPRRSRPGQTSRLRSARGSRGITTTCPRRRPYGTTTRSAMWTVESGRRIGCLGRTLSIALKSEWSVVCFSALRFLGQCLAYPWAMLSFGCEEQGRAVAVVCPRVQAHLYGRSEMCSIAVRSSQALCVSVFASSVGLLDHYLSSIFVRVLSQTQITLGLGIHGCSGDVHRSTNVWIEILRCTLPRSDLRAR